MGQCRSLPWMSSLTHPKRCGLTQEMAEASLACTWGTRGSGVQQEPTERHSAVDTRLTTLDPWRFIMVSKYLPKYQHFLYKGMVTWSQLAALDHNANTSRNHVTVSTRENKGELYYKVVFTKQSKEWVAKPVMEKTTRGHLQPVLDAIVERKNRDAADRNTTLTAPHITQHCQGPSTG